MTLLHQPQVFFQNHQWRVTCLGLETLPGANRVYWVDAKDLLALHLDGHRYRWPLVMAVKNWVDFDAFVQAYEAAIAHHRPDADLPHLAASIAAGRVQRIAPRTPRVPATPSKRFFPRHW